ncbi:hypothetical protein MGWOODY_Tha2730 [hydrothermal vent metagenome]|uniref:Uncharacterized protein n=1 Tax=hydrothermal vent metagenome TaxID=652676 RepID=A0A160TCF0_9ZZZZ
MAATNRVACLTTILLPSKSSGIIDKKRIRQLTFVTVWVEDVPNQDIFPRLSSLI